MEDKTQVVIDIKIEDSKVAERLAAVNSEMETLKTNNRELKDEIKKGNDAMGENSKKLAENEAKLKSLKAEQSALSGQIAETTRRNRQYGDSYKELSARLNDLKNGYRSLSKEQRESDEGKAMLKQIQSLDKEMKAADASIGNFQRNVGDYANQVAKISGLFGSAGGAASTLTGKLGLVTKGMGALAATPLIGAITLLITLVQKVATAMKGSEEITMKWKETTAAFKPLIIAIQNGLTALADILVGVVQTAIKGVTAAMEGLAKATDWVGKLFGKDWGLTKKTEELKAQAAAQRELTKAENEYVIARRALMVEESEDNAKIAELREKSADSEKYNANERRQFLKEAMDLEQQLANKRVLLAEKNLAILRQQASYTQNNAEMNDKLAEAEVAVNNARAEAAQHMRSMNREMKQLNNTINSEATAAWNAYIAKVKETREAMSGLIDELKSRDLADNIARDIKVAEEALASIEKIDRNAYQSFSDVTDKGLDDIERRSNAMVDFALVYKENAKTIEGVSSSLESSFGSLASMYSKMAEDETKSEEERARAAKAAKRWSALQIAANSGTAIAKGVATAMDEPWPANIAALASVMAAVLSAIAQAKALASEGHEHGGVIGGRFVGATSGADNVVMTGRRGELVLNADQQRRLYEIANGSQQPNTAAQLAAALQNMPAPVLVYSEFRNFSNRVVALDEAARLR